MIQLRDIQKAVDSGGGKLFIVRRIHLEVKEREFVIVMGPSGAGKSTLLSILGMLDHAWAGEYRLRGCVCQFKNDLRGRI